MGGHVAQAPRSMSGDAPNSRSARARAPNNIAPRRIRRRPGSAARTGRLAGHIDHRFGAGFAASGAALGPALHQAPITQPGKSPLVANFRMHGGSYTLPEIVLVSSPKFALCAFAICSACTERYKMRLIENTSRQFVTPVIWFKPLCVVSFAASHGPLSLSTRFLAHGCAGPFDPDSSATSPVASASGGQC